MSRPVVALADDEYVRPLQKADEWEPELPPPDADGNRPAVEYVRALLRAASSATGAGLA